MPNSKCPICGRTITDEIHPSASMPFCSSRCRQIDMNRWLGEQYSVPATPSDDEESEPTPNGSTDDHAE